MIDTRELSTHLDRGKKGKDEALEGLLDYWGAWRAKAIGLGTGSITSIAVAMEMRKSESVRVSDIPQPKQTRNVQPITPRYFIHYQPVKVNKAVFEIQSRYAEILIRMYEDCWTKQDFLRERNWVAGTYYTRICEAKRAIRKHPQIKQLHAKSEKATNLI